jgi:hypothetical protein
MLSTPNLLRSIRTNEFKMMLFARSLISVRNRPNSMTSSNLIGSKPEAPKILSNPVGLDTKFEDSEIAFKSKSNMELVRGLLVFQLCTLNALVDNQHQVKWL